MSPVPCPTSDRFTLLELRNVKAPLLPNVAIPPEPPSPNVVAAPKALTVVAVVLNSVRLVAGVAMVGLRKFKVPVVAPIVAVEAAWKAVIVVALVSNKLKVVAGVEIVGLRKLSVPVVAPTVKVEAACKTVAVVALVSNKLRVVDGVDIVGLRKLSVPVVAPIWRVDAAPAKFRVVATVLKTSKLALADTMLVVILGEVPKTATPVPVSSLSALESAAEVPVLTRFLLESVKTACEAVRLLALKVVP